MPWSEGPWAKRIPNRRGGACGELQGGGRAQRGASASHWRVLSSLRYVTETARDQAAPDPSRCAWPAAGGLGARTPGFPEICGPSPASQSHPATNVTSKTLSYKSSNRLARKLRVASQPSVSSPSPSPTRCRHPPPGPQSSGLGGRSHWPALRFQHHSSCCGTIVNSLHLSIFLPKNVPCYPYSHTF